MLMVEPATESGGDDRIVTLNAKTMEADGEDDAEEGLMTHEPGGE